MSLFRPDRISDDHQFVPLRFDAAKHGFVSESGFSAQGFAQTGEDTRGTTVSEAAAPVAGSPETAIHHLTEFQLEEIEAAAYARGEAAAQQESVSLAAACAAIEKAGLDLARTAASELAANREETVALVAEATRRWVGAELRLDPGLFANLLEGVLVDVDATEEAQLFLNPEELATFSVHEEARAQLWSEKFGVALLGDASLAAGDFRVETPIHRVDGRSEVICERFTAALAVAVEATPPEGEQ